MEVVGSAEAAESLHGELDAFEKARHGCAELAEVFANPGVDHDSKIRVARDIAARLSIGEIGQRVLEVLVRNHRINQLGPILEALRFSINEKLDRAVAEVRSAREMTPDEQAGLKQALEKKIGRRVELTVATDPSLLGGFVAKYGSEVWDASVVGQISRLKESLS